MKPQKVKLVYFSPTGTSRKVLEGIAQGIGVEDIEHIDLTLPKNAHRSITTRSEELVLIGTPVYGGRLPVDAIARLKQLKVENSLAVLIVTYGNREFDDALLELKHLAIELGFNPIAGGAFIGEHSFASKEVPVANGRPDDLDLQTATSFGKKIKEKIDTFQSSAIPIVLEVPGSFPYKAEGARAMAVSPVTREYTCTVCGACASVCPSAAISVNGRVTTEIEKCIRCCACIKNCPEGARVMKDETWEYITNWLHENCNYRKEPQVFGVD